MTPAEKQKRFRDRRSEQFARRGRQLQKIIDRLEGNEKALAVELREIAEEGLR